MMMPLRKGGNYQKRAALVKITLQNLVDASARIERNKVSAWSASISLTSCNLVKPKLRRNALRIGKLNCLRLC